MYRLFQELPLMNKGVVSLPEFIYVRGFYLRQLEVIKEYYHQTQRNVDNEHILVRLLLMLNVSFQRDYQNYVDVVADKALRLSSQLRMTSSLNHGFAFEQGVFYGSNVVEIIVADDEDFDVDDAVANWQSLTPIRVLRHPFTDLNMARPDGNYQGSDERGFAVIEVNVAKLALQYRRWYETEGYDDSRDGRLSIHQYVSMYPLTNMIGSHLDIAVFNRMAALYDERAVAPFKRCHPFFIPDYSSRVDAVLEKLIKIQEYRKMEFDQTLMGIPLITADTLYEAMMLPEIAMTRQVRWALIIARLPLIKFLLRLNDETNNHRNTAYLSRMRIALREIRSDNTLRQGMNGDIIQEIEQSIYEDIEPYL